MILLIISILLITISSYFITSILAPNKNPLGLVYLLILGFAQIILFMEFLSVISAIKPLCIIGANIIFFDVIWYIWVKKNKPLWSLDFEGFKKKINTSLKLDKALLWLYIGWSVMIVSAIILNVLLPSTNADASAYHVARSFFWAAQGHLNHFPTAEARAICLPINSEIVYTWVITFLKKDIFLGFSGLWGYLLSIISVYKINHLIGFSTRRNLWVIFILSSFASVLVQASGTETDIVIAGLISASIFLFWYGIKNKEKTPVYISALAYALALGTKTPAFFAAIGVGIFILALCAHYKNFKILKDFTIAGLVSLILFSSYNYILNFLDFGNFMSHESIISVAKNEYGFKGLIANSIKHFFLIFDFTGFTWSRMFGPEITAVKNSLLNLFQVADIPNGTYTPLYTVKINNGLLEPLMGPGVLGALAFLPCLIFSLIYPIFKFTSNKVKFLMGFGGIFFINIAVMSGFIAFMPFNTRFVMTYIVLSSPILAYSYFRKKNIFKNIMVLFAVFYFVFVSTNLWARPLTKIVKLLQNKATLQDIWYRGYCKDFDKISFYRNPECIVQEEILNKYSKKNNILFFINSSDNILVLEKLKLDGYNVEFASIENNDKIDFSKYNVVIMNKNGQKISNLKNFANPKEIYYMISDEQIGMDTPDKRCVYYTPKKINTEHLKTQERIIYPYHAICNFSKGFWDRNSFHQIGSLKFKMAAEQTPLEYTYLENKNNPIIWNKK